MPSALVLDLAAAANRFTLRDRMELDRWGGIAQARGLRIAVHERQDGDPSDVGNYAAVYAAGCCWASWALSRRPGGIVVWDCATGRDKGRFATAHEALGWALGRHPGPGCGLPATEAGRPGQEPRTVRLAGARALVEGVGFEPT